MRFILVLSFLGLTFLNAFDGRELAFVLESEEANINESVTVEQKGDSLLIFFPHSSLPFKEWILNKDFCLIKKDGQKLCKDGEIFQKLYLGKSYYAGFLYEVLSGKEIYEGRALEREDGCFSQNFEEIKYKVCGKNIRFEDGEIRIILHDLI